MSNAIVVPTTVDLMARDTRNELHNMTQKLVKLVPGGRKLDPEQASELAVASLITGANPFLGEIYHAGYSGIMIGIEFHKRKADEALVEETGQRGQLFYEFRPASHDEAVFNESLGDIAWTVKLTDSASKARAIVEQMKMLDKLTEKGMDAEKAWAIAERSFPVPFWEASAVVYHDEKFVGKVKEFDPATRKYVETDKDQPEKWDRNERCKKRCTKQVLKKRFSTYTGGGSNDDDVVIVEGIAREVAQEIAKEMADHQAEIASKPPAQLMQELGYDPEPVIVDATQPVQEEKPKEEKKPAPKKKERPYTGEQVRESVSDFIERNKATEVADRQRDVLAKQLSTLYDGDKTQRYEASKYLFGSSSTRDMSPKAVLAGLTWLGVNDFNDVPAQHCIQEAKNVLEAALIQSGQIKMEL